MDPIDKARKLIEKGKKTKNKQLVELGEQLITKYTKSQQQTDFTMVRNKNVNREVYDEQGNKIGTKTIKQPIEVGTNQFIDTKREFLDRQNEQLKKFTVRSPRNRPISQMIIATCTQCGKQERVHPLHTKISVYRCSECVKKLTR